jgi:hypothetical protein
MTMIKPSNHSQYCSRKPASAIFLAGGAVVTGGLSSGGKTAGAAFSTIGAGAATGVGVTALGGVILALATFLFAFWTTCLGAGATLTAGCSAMIAEAGAGSGAASGADGFSAATTTGAGAATGTSFGLVAQADKTKAEKRRAAGIATLSVLDMAFSKNTIGDLELELGWNLPTVNRAPQTIKCCVNKGLSDMSNNYPPAKSEVLR